VVSAYYVTKFAIAYNSNSTVYAMDYTLDYNHAKRNDPCWILYSPRIASTVNSDVQNARSDDVISVLATATNDDVRKLSRRRRHDVISRPMRHPQSTTDACVALSAAPALCRSTICRGNDEQNKRHACSARRTIASHIDPVSAPHRPPLTLGAAN